MAIKNFDYKKCSRPLLFKENDEYIPYSLGGTCFLFEYENHHYIITAMHCLKARDIASITVLIDPWSSDKELYPFSFTSPFHILPNGTDPDEDYLDFICYPVGCGSLGSLLWWYISIHSAGDKSTTSF